MATSAEILDKQKLEFWIQVYTHKEKYNWLLFEIEVQGNGHCSISLKYLKDSFCSAYYLAKCPLVLPSLNHFMYVVGRNKESEDYENNRCIKILPENIYRLDTSNLEEGWTKVDVELKKPQLYPNIAVLDGKFYIFKTDIYYGPPPKRLRKILPTEVYDPVKNTINVLPEYEDNYPLDLRLVGVGVDRDFKRIILFSKEQGNLFFYYPDEHKWVITKPHKDIFRFVEIVFAITNETFYWVDGRHLLVAYDFNKQKFSEPIGLGFISNYLELISDDGFMNFAILFHLNGDRFCLFWYKKEPVFVESFLHCTFLSISNSYEDGNFFLDVSEMGTKTFNIPHPGFIIKHIVPVYLKQGATFRHQSTATSTVAPPEPDTTLPHQPPATIQHQRMTFGQLEFLATGPPPWKMI